MSKNTPPTVETPADKAAAKAYKNLVDLIALISEGSARLEDLENGLKQEYLVLIDDRRAEYASLQHVLGEAEKSIELLAVTNPQWFEKKKTLKTPYGSIAFRASSKLVVKNEEASIILLEQLGQDGLPFIRETKELNLEALEKLDDSELARLRIRREKGESFKITPLKVDLGKGVKAAAGRETES